MSTVIGMVGNNIESVAKGEDAVYSADEIFCATYENAIVSTVMSSGVRVSNTGVKLKGSCIFDITVSKKSTTLTLADLGVSAILSAFDGVRNSTPFQQFYKLSHGW